MTPHAVDKKEGGNGIDGRSVNKEWGTQIFSSSPILYSWRSKQKGKTMASWTATEYRLIFQYNFECILEVDRCMEVTSVFGNDHLSQATIYTWYKQLQCQCGDLLFAKYFRVGK